MAKEKKGGETKKATGGALSKTARRSMMDGKNAQPKVIGWAWEKGIRVGQGRKPDYQLFSEAEVALFDPQDFIVIKANSAWIGGTTPGQRK